MVDWAGIPLQTDEIQLSASTPVTLDFRVYLDSNPVTNISSATFVVTQGIPNSSFVINVPCTVSGNKCSAVVPGLTDSGDYVAEMSLILVDGSVHTPFQGYLRVP
jgi:hypothetical protein